MSYTDTHIEKAWEAGFEAGVAYTFGHIPEGSLTQDEVFKFADWAELKYPWNTTGEWYDLILRNYRRLTRDIYEGCKQQYAENREKYRDNPGMLKVIDMQEENFEKGWKRIVEAGWEYDERYDPE